MLIFFGSGRGGYINVVRHFQGQVLECWPESFFFCWSFSLKVILENHFIVIDEDIFVDVFLRFRSTVRYFYFKFSSARKYQKTFDVLLLFKEDLTPPVGEMIFLAELTIINMCQGDQLAAKKISNENLKKCKSISLYRRSPSYIVFWQ